MPLQGDQQLHASRAGQITFRLLKASPVNEMLAALYRFQRTSAAFWGQNTITLRQVATGDNYKMLGCLFERFPSNAYAKVVSVLEWIFHVAHFDPILGAGIITEAGGLPLGAGPIVAAVPQTLRKV